MDDASVERSVSAAYSDNESSVSERSSRHSTSGNGDKPLDDQQVLEEFKAGLKDQSKGGIVSDEELIQYVSTFKHFQREGDTTTARVKTWRRVSLLTVFGGIVLSVIIFAMVVGGIEWFKSMRPSSTSYPVLTSTENEEMVGVAQPRFNARLDEIVTMADTNPGVLRSLEALTLPTSETRAKVNVAWISIQPDVIYLYSNEPDTYVVLSRDTTEPALFYQIGETEPFVIHYDTDFDEAVEVEEDVELKRSVRTVAKERFPDKHVERTPKQFSEEFDRTVCELIMDFGGCVDFCKIEGRTDENGQPIDLCPSVAGFAYND